MAKVTKTETYIFITPWKMVATYADGEELYFHGNDEEDCMADIIEEMDRHGDITWYSNYTGELIV